MNLFAHDSYEFKTLAADSKRISLETKSAAEKLNHYIAANAPRQAIELLRNSSKDEVFNALIRNNFSIVGNRKKDYIAGVQNTLLAACAARKSIPLIGY